ncbi:MAG: N-acetylglucosaminyl deacetylase, LmbE family [Verrucomicrobia bacterium]|nr:N-acetylglucosaminyl deacetylase, LmbE family [Verrucomicrobiota bacterium]
MKPTPTSRPELPPLLAFGAHPDDIEFGAGGVVARERSAGRPVHFVVCSRGEAGTHGTPRVRAAEARAAARVLGATIEFLELDGDARLELKAAHALGLARVIRRVRPGIVLAPTVVPNQHPDHWRLGVLARDAARLARFGGLAPLRKQPPHAIGQLFFYALSPGAEPPGMPPVLIDISAPEIMRLWRAAMAAHASQMRTRNYAELQVTRARVAGLAAGIDHAQALFPNDPLVLDSLAAVTRSARRF